MYCENCGKELIDGASFCDSCGAAAPAESAPADAAPRGFGNRRKIIILIIAAAVALFGTVTAVAVVSNVSISAKVNDALELAQRYLNEYNYEQAIVEFQRVLKLDIGNVEAYLGLAEAYVAMGDKQSAIDILQSGYEITGDERLKQKLDELSASAQSYDLYRTNTLAVYGKYNDNLRIIVALDDGRCMWYDGEIHTSDVDYAGKYTNSRVVSVDVDTNNFAWLCEDGTVHGYGDRGAYIDGEGYVREGYVNNYNDIVDISVGYAEAFLLHADGTVSVIPWKYSNNDEIYQSVLSWSDIIMIKKRFGEGGILGLRSDGTVVGVGLVGTSVYSINVWTDIVDVACTQQTIFGLKSDGTIVKTEENDFSFNSVSEWSNIVSIVASPRYIVGLNSSERVFVADVFGSYLNLDVSSWTDICAIAISTDNQIVGLKSDGTLVMSCPEEIETDIDYNGQFADVISQISDVSMPIRSYQNDM